MAKPLPKKKSVGAKRGKKVEPGPHAGSLVQVNLFHLRRPHRDCTKTKDGSCDYQENCGNPDGYEDWEAHHVVCISSVMCYTELYARGSDSRKNVSIWLTKTNWCINRKVNLVPLPMRYEYQRFAGQRYKGAPVNKCCHDWDHNIEGGYTDEVDRLLKQEVFPSLARPYPAEACVDKDDVASGLNTIAGQFKGKLRARGQRKGGTADILKKTNAELQELGPWWLPFSMACAAVASLRKVASFNSKLDWQSGYKKKLEALGMLRG